MFMFHECGEQKLTRRDALSRPGSAMRRPRGCLRPSAFLTSPSCRNASGVALSTLYDIRNKQHHQPGSNPQNQPAWRWTRSGGRTTSARARRSPTSTSKGTPRAPARTATRGPGSKFRWGRTPRSRESRCRRYWPSLSVNPPETRQTYDGVTH